MTPKEMRATLARLELTQVGAAWLLGVTDRTVRYWCAGDREIPISMQRMLDVIEQVPAARKRLQWLAEQD
jgi:DNA-binding transcriptional regulator YiaG